MLVSPALLLLALAPRADFDADLRQAARDYGPPRERAAACYAKGDLRGGEALLLEAVPEEKRSAAHCFLLGSMFFALDPELSRRMHGQAYTLAPEHPDVQREWAIELHRAHEYAQAEALYAAYTAARAEPVADALHAECLLHLGREHEALDAWKRALRSGALKKVFLVVAPWISNAESYEQKRLRLRADFAAGKLEVAEELLFHDLFKPGGTRRYDVDRAGLDQDQKLLASQLEVGSRRMRELQGAASYWLSLWEQGFPAGEPVVPVTTLRLRADELGWLSAGANLPENALTLRWTVDALLESHLRGARELLAEHERELAARLEEGELEAGLALLHLQRAAENENADENTDEHAEETLEALWRKCRDADAAATLLERRGTNLKSDHALLRAALEAHPNAPRLCRLASACARREGHGEREALLREIAAGFQSPDAFAAVDAAFVRLEELSAPAEKR